MEALQETANSEADTPELIAKLREKAGELGCDALMLNDTFSRVDQLNTLLTGNTYDRRGMSGTCVVYVDAASESRPLVLLTPAAPPPSRAQAQHSSHP